MPNFPPGRWERVWGRKQWGVLRWAGAEAKEKLLALLGKPLTMFQDVRAGVQLQLHGKAACSQCWTPS